MKKLNIIYLLPFLIFFSISSFDSFSQSIGGNMNSENIVSLGYGNVDIYKGKEKIASVLTDHLGNFSVKLDTGYYRIEFKYEGHEKLVKNIRVKGDEKDNFALSKKDGYFAPRYDVPKVESTESYSYSKEEKLMFGDAIREEVSEIRIVRDKSAVLGKPTITTFDAPSDSDYKKSEKINAGSLTAG